MNHAACSPSSASMWLQCPASVTQAEGLTRPSSRYAREGTAAHATAEMILKGDVFLPDKIEVEGQEFIVSLGMCRALNPYVSYVELLQALPGARVFLEYRLEVPGTFGMVWGTLDCGVHALDVLHIVDLKFGKGIAVDPADPQLKLYALALAAYVKEYRPDLRVVLTICQPRASGEPLRHYETTLGELHEWRMGEVYPALSRIAEGDPTEVTGAYCRWCVRSKNCKAFNERHQSHAADAFDDEP